jgi:hypothetical protein
MLLTEERINAIRSSVIKMGTMFFIKSGSPGDIYLPVWNIAGPCEHAKLIPSHGFQ